MFSTLVFKPLWGLTNSGYAEFTPSNFLCGYIETMQLLLGP